MAWHPVEIATALLVLSGPMVRRFEPRSVTVWLALKEPCTVTLRIFSPDGTVADDPLDAADVTRDNRIGPSAQTLSRVVGAVANKCPNWWANGIADWTVGRPPGLPLLAVGRLKPRSRLLSETRGPDQVHASPIKTPLSSSRDHRRTGELIALRLLPMTRYHSSDSCFPMETAHLCEERTRWRP